MQELISRPNGTFFWLKQIYTKDNLQKCQSTRHILTLQKYCFLDFDYVDTNLLYLTIYKNSKRKCFRRMLPTCELLANKWQYFVAPSNWKLIMGTMHHFFSVQYKAWLYWRKSTPPEIQPVQVLVQVMDGTVWARFSCSSSIEPIKSVNHQGRFFHLKCFELLSVVKSLSCQDRRRFERHTCAIFATKILSHLGTLKFKV